MGDTYIKLNDALPEHRKIVAAGGDAGWLHVCGLAYASRNLSDGRIPIGMVARLSDRKQPDKLASKLCEVRLWHEAGHDCDRCPQPDADEYIIHDYLKHQRSADHVTAIKAKRATAGRNGGNKKAANARQSATATAQQGSSNLLDGCYGDVEANETPDTEEVLRTSQTDTDTPPTSSGPPKGSVTDRGTRLPDAFAVTAEMAAWARENAPLCGPKDHEAFCDYWRGVPGVRGRKKDWVATWRNWMRKEQERREPSPTSKNGTVIPLDRRQQATNDLFSRAMERAAAREEGS